MFSSQTLFAILSIIWTVYNAGRAVATLWSGAEAAGDFDVPPMRL